MDYYNKKESCPWLYEFDGPPTSDFDKLWVPFEYAFESETQRITKFKKNFSDDCIDSFNSNNVTYEIATP